MKGPQGGGGGGGGRASCESSLHVSKELFMDIISSEASSNKCQDSTMAERP